MRWIAGRLSRWAADRQRRNAIRHAVQAAQSRRSHSLADPDLSALGRLLHWWDRTPSPDPPEREICALERQYSLRLPDDFRAYLRAAMPDGNEWDDEGTRWFPLAEIKSLREECPDWSTESALDSDKLLVFADYLIWCYAWAIDCSETENRGKIALITANDHYVADSFDDFLDRYLRDDSALHR